MKVRARVVHPDLVDDLRHRAGVAPYTVSPTASALAVSPPFMDCSNALVSVRAARGPRLSSTSAGYARPQRGEDEMTTSSTPSPDANEQDTDLELCELPIQGMTCASCVRRVERALLGVPCVDAATVNFATQRARVSYDASRATQAALVQAVEAAGYQVPGGSGGGKRFHQRARSASAQVLLLETQPEAARQNQAVRSRVRENIQKVGK